MPNLTPCPSPRGTNVERLYLVRKPARMALDQAMPDDEENYGGTLKTEADDIAAKVRELLVGKLDDADLEALLEELLSEAAEARAQYLESVGTLGWLLRQSPVPSSDARARQIVAGADTAPSAWPEAKTAGVQTMETALSALLADQHATSK